MSISNDPATIATLQGVLDELCSPDLTLGRANVLRRRLNQLLEALHSGLDEGPVDRLQTRAEPGLGSHLVALPQTLLECCLSDC
jgi:hypothetical protein